MCKKMIVVLAMLLMALQVGAEPIKMGHWKFDDGEGTVAVDSSDNGNDGELINGASWATGKLDGCVSLDGDDGYVDLPISTLWQDMNDVTFACWVNWSGEGDVWQRVWDFGTGSTVHTFLCIDTGSYTRFIFTIDTYNDEKQINIDTIGTGWHHIAVTHDYAASTAIMYIDGVEEGDSDDIDVGLPDLMEEAGEDGLTQCWLGRSEYSADPYFNGQIDDFRIYDSVLSPAEVKIVMTGSETFETAGIVNPANGATDVALDDVLQWQAGLYAETHDFYFGTTYDDVNDATTSDPLGATVLEGLALDETTYVPDEEFVLDQTYYWRVDEINETSGLSYKGSVWSFTAEPIYLYPTPVVVSASSYDASASDYNSIPENTVNGSGLSNGLHSVQPGDMWRTADGESDGAWIEYEFDVAYQFNQLLVWNYNEAYEAFIGIGVKDAEIQTSMDGETWTTAATVELTQCTTNVATAVTSTVDLGGPVAKFVRINVLSKWGTFQAKVGLSEVQFEAIPLAARRPSPESGENVDSLFDELVWRLGRGAEQSQLYLSTDANLVAAGDASALVDDGISGRRYMIADTGALYGETYYWRIDEVAGDQVTAGAVWDFNTPDHYVIDDMEAYGYSNWIYETWLDGFDENLNNRDDNGSEIGDAEPYVEQEICFSGVQSLPMFYDNTHGEDAAWVELAVDSEIFAVGGVSQLSVLFMGDRGNTGGEFYVTIGNKTVTSDASLTSGVWTQMIVDLSEFGNLNSATTLILGVAGSGEEGVVYIDDVCLYREAPLLAAAQAVQPSDDGLVVYYQMEENLNDSAGSRDGQSATTLFYEDSLSEGALSLGQALSLEGLEDSYVDVNDVMGDLVASLTDSTYAAWVKLTEDSDSSWMRVFDFGTGTDAYMFLSPRSGTAGAPEFGILSPDSDSAAEQDVAGTAMLTSGWHHLAVTIEQGDPNGTLTLYVDGVMADTDETDTLPSDIGETTNNWLGRSQWADDGYFDGLLDEVRIYDRALSEGEIRWLAGDQ